MNRRAFLATSAALIQPLVNKSAFAQAPELSAKRHRVAVLGHTGHGNYGHGLDSVWRLIPQTEVVALADPDTAGRAAAKAKLGGVADYADYTVLLREVQPDIVAVCPRHVHEHHAMIVAAIAAGARGIYVEKPFVRTPAEADDVRRLCREKGVKLAVAHRNRYHPALPVLADLLASGAFGSPLEIRARGKEDQRGGGLDLWVLGSHVLNLGTYLAGAPLACSAAIFEQGRPATDADIHEGDEGLGPLLGDEIHARFEMERGLPLFFDSKKNAGARTTGFGLQLLCTGGIIDLHIDTEPLIQWLAGNPFKPTTDLRQWTPITSAGLGKPEPLKSIGEFVAKHVGPVEDMLRTMEHGGEPLCGPEAAGDTVEMIHGVFTSYKRGGARVALPLESRLHALKG